jgi:hypothetical protein
MADTRSPSGARDNKQKGPNTWLDSLTLTPDPILCCYASELPERHCTTGLPGTRTFYYHTHTQTHRHTDARGEGPLRCSSLLGVDHPSSYRLAFPFLLTTESAHPSVCELQAGRHGRQHCRRRGRDRIAALSIPSKLHRLINPSINQGTVCSHAPRMPASRSTNNHG